MLLDLEPGDNTIKNNEKELSTANDHLKAVSADEKQSTKSTFAAVSEDSSLLSSDSSFKEDTGADLLASGVDNDASKELYSVTELPEQTTTSLKVRRLHQEVLYLFMSLTANK